MPARPAHWSASTSAWEWLPYAHPAQLPCERLSRSPRPTYGARCRTVRSHPSLGRRAESTNDRHRGQPDATPKPTSRQDPQALVLGNWANPRFGSSGARPSTTGASTRTPPSSISTTVTRRVTAAVAPHPLTAPGPLALLTQNRGPTEQRLAQHLGRPRVRIRLRIGDRSPAGAGWSTVVDRSALST